MKLESCRVCGEQITHFELCKICGLPVQTRCEHCNSLSEHAIHAECAIKV